MVTLVWLHWTVRWYWIILLSAETACVNVQRASCSKMIIVIHLLVHVCLLDNGPYYSFHALPLLGKLTHTEYLVKRFIIQTLRNNKIFDIYNNYIFLSYVVYISYYKQECDRCDSMIYLSMTLHQVNLNRDSNFLVFLK